MNNHSFDILIFHYHKNDQDNHIYYYLDLIFYFQPIHHKQYNYLHSLKNIFEFILIFYFHNWNMYNHSFDILIFHYHKNDQDNHIYYYLDLIFYFQPIHHKQYNYLHSLKNIFEFILIFYFHNWNMYNHSFDILIFHYHNIYQYINIY